MSAIAGISAHPELVTTWRALTGAPQLGQVIEAPSDGNRHQGQVYLDEGGASEGI
jgi:hypothetical protein